MVSHLLVLLVGLTFTTIIRCSIKSCMSCIFLLLEDHHAPDEEIQAITIRSENDVLDIFTFEDDDSL
jgi:hypothetical protein